LFEMPAKDTLILDFDGTITTVDLGDAVCDRFADERWRAIDAAWERKELSLHEAQRRMWALVSASEAELLSAVDELAVLREGFRGLLDVASARFGRLLVASGGFDLYIDRVLGPLRARFAEVLCNTMRLDGRGVAIGFPHLGTLSCELCAVCKGKVCDRERAAGGRVVFVGDGTSDRCAIGRADVLFAIRGSKLARACEAAGAPYEPFTTFTELARRLEARGGTP
jgi:2,3-diketo-5-methylthio-1-phosphopentane phosphatase